MNRGDHLATIAEVLAGTTGAKVPYPIGIRELEVVRSEMVGTGLLRLTLGGPELAASNRTLPTSMFAWSTRMQTELYVYPNATDSA